jgi:hypothetical protein
MYNRGKFGNNTHPRCIRRRSNLGYIFRGKKVRLMGREIRYIFFFFTRLFEKPLLGSCLISPSFSCASQCYSSVVFVYPSLFRNHVIPQAWLICPKSECCHFISYQTIWMWPDALCVLFKVGSPVVTLCTTRFNVEIFYVLPTQCICVLYIDLRTNSGFRRIQCKLLFVTAMESVYCLVRSGSSNRKECIAYYVSLYVHFDIYRGHSLTNALFIKLEKALKFTLKFTLSLLLHVSVYDHPEGAYAGVCLKLRGRLKWKPEKCNKNSKHSSFVL